jgi:hypothetical protein
MTLRKLINARKSASSRVAKRVWSRPSPLLLGTGRTIRALLLDSLRCVRRHRRYYLGLQRYEGARQLRGFVTTKADSQIDR